jgi:uncharacterized glyoxalase superfamily protein PhnB
LIHRDRSVIGAVTSVQDGFTRAAYGVGMVIPTLRYKDARAAIDFLESAFGFDGKIHHENEDGTIAHAELTYGRGMVMIGSAGTGDPQFDTRQSSIYVVVADPDAAYGRAKASGAEITREIEDMDYGSREFTARDPEGNVWSFGTYDPFAA